MPGKRTVTSHRLFAHSKFAHLAPFQLRRCCADRSIGHFSSLGQKEKLGTEKASEDVIKSLNMLAQLQSRHLVGNRHLNLRTLPSDIFRLASFNRMLRLLFSPPFRHTAEATSLKTVTSLFRAAVNAQYHNF